MCSERQFPSFLVMWVSVSAVLCIPQHTRSLTQFFFFFFFKDTLRECRPEDRHCLTYLPWVSPIYFVTFVLMAQFVLVNVVVAVLMKHLEESNKVQIFRVTTLMGFNTFLVDRSIYILIKNCVCSCRRLKRMQRWTQRLPWKWPWSSSAGQAPHRAAVLREAPMLDHVHIHRDR